MGVREMREDLRTMKRVSSQSRRIQTVVRQESGEGNFTGEKPSKLLYMGVAMIALFKDTLDLAIGPLLGIVTVIGLCTSFLIWILLLVFDRSGGRHNMKLARSVLQLVVAIIESLGIGLNYLPWQTATVVILYVMAKKAWRKQAKEASAQRGQGTGYVDEDFLEV